MQKATLGARIVLGLIYFVFGLNYFFHFLPLPEMPEGAANFMGALAATGYMFPFVKVTEIIGGALLLAGFFVPLAMTILAPITLNILVFHLFLEPSGTPMALVLVALQVFLAWAYRDSFAGVLNAKAKPSV